jgi:hypothetical protein
MCFCKLRATYFSTCVCSGASSSSSLKNIKVLCSFSQHQAWIWLPTRGREAFVLTKWDNWSDKTIVSNNILLPPPSLQSSRIMWPPSSMICSCHRNYVNWSFIMLIEYVANKAFHLQQLRFHCSNFLWQQTPWHPIKPFYKLECHSILH